jgi:hypothetical protein
VPSSITVLQYLPYVLPIAFPALWLLRCLLSALLGRRPDGGCVLCFPLTALGFIFWPEVAPFVGIDGPLRTFNLPDDMGLRLLITGFFLLAVGLLLYVIPWLVRRFDRREGYPATADVWLSEGPARADDGWDEVLDDFADIRMDGADAGDAGA